MWRKLLDGITWEFHYQIEFVLNDKIKKTSTKNGMYHIAV